MRPGGAPAAQLPLPRSLATRCSAPSALDNLAAHLTTRLFLLGDAAEQLAAAADGAAPAVEEAKNSGFFGAFAGAFETFLKVLDDGLEKVGVPYRWAGDR